jgi:hypothetical protein
MKYAHINDNNQLLGWYDADIHTTIPTPNIEVTDEVWQDALENNHNKINADGTTELFDFRTFEEKVKQDLDEKINEAKRYLSSTDFYYARKLETGKEVPVDVVTKRIESRTFIQENLVDTLI